MDTSETTMSKLCATLLALAALLAPHAGAAAPFDGSKPIQCAVAETFECAAGTECQRGLAEHINAPEFLLIDVKKKQITGLGESPKQKPTPIGAVERVEGLLILHGVDAYHGWSLVIGGTGKMSLTVSAHRVGLVMFGACTIP